MLLGGCLTPEGPTRSDVLSQLTGGSDEAANSPQEILQGHRWGGWHTVVVDAKLCEPLLEACALERAGLVEDAIEHLSRVQRRHSRSACVLEARGALYASLGYQRAAAGDFQRAVWVEPKRAEAWAALGRVQTELDLFQQALAALERAGELGLDTHGYHVGLARAYRGLERRGRAADHYQRAIDCCEDPTVELYVEAATLATEGGSDVLETEALEHALRLVDRALEDDPSSSQAWFVRALLLEAADEEADTVAAYLRALEIDPEHVAAWTKLALLSLRLGDPETCSEAARRAIDLETDPRRRRALEKLLERRL